MKKEHVGRAVEAVHTISDHLEAVERTHGSLKRLNQRQEDEETINGLLDLAVAMLLIWRAIRTFTRKENR